MVSKTVTFVACLALAVSVSQAQFLYSPYVVPGIVPYPGYGFYGWGSNKGGSRPPPPVEPITEGSVGPPPEGPMPKPESALPSMSLTNSAPPSPLVKKQ
ncbi:hypothetical protein AAVH_23184 [Aphelenchoides avenae]|nr:hypothetical protein AAVH_23184 [Aphelenchus avenae]